MNREDYEMFAAQQERDHHENPIEDDEARASREAHEEEVNEMRMAREIGEYDCGQDDSENDENCSDCHYWACPKKLEVRRTRKNIETRRRRERRQRARAKRALVRPNYKAYLNYFRSRKIDLETKGHSRRACNAIIFEEWSTMTIDQKLPFYDAQESESPVT